MTDDDARVLTACQGICLLLGIEAVMRIDSSMTSDDFSDSHKKWMTIQRMNLIAFLEVLGAPPFDEDEEDDE